MTTTKTWLACGLLAAAACGSAAAQETTEVSPFGAMVSAAPRAEAAPFQADWGTFTQQFLAATSGRLEVGTRMTFFLLLETDKNTFLGSINHLDAVQDAVPDKLYADWFFSPLWGVELAWDRVRARTTSPPIGASDGDFVLTGPILTAVGRYPNWTPFTPSAGIGFGYLFGGWDADAWWHLGYPSPEDWEHAAHPDKLYLKKERIMKPSNSLAFVLTAACDAQITARWSANVCARYMRADTDVEFDIFRANELIADKGVTTIPMSSFALGLGVRYAF